MPTTCLSLWPIQMNCTSKELHALTFLCFSAAQGTLHEDVCMFDCCWRNKFSFNTFLCNAQYFCAVDSDGKLNKTHRRYCCVSIATMVRRKRYDVMLQVLFLYCCSYRGKQLREKIIIKKIIFKSSLKPNFFFLGYRII